MKYRYIREPGTRSYRAKRAELSPDGKEKLRRWLERADAERRRKFPHFYKD